MTYKVPLIPTNLRKNETIVQIADSLDYLSQVVDDIMLHIDNRVSTYSNKLKSVQSRVDIVERKITQLQGVKNAIEVFSSTKYPATDIDRTYVSIFPSSSNIPLSRHVIKQKSALKNEEPLEKLHIYHVQLSELKQHKIEGLGPISNDIEHVNDLLLYNSGKNLYTDMKISNVSQVHRSSFKTEESKINIGVAPESIGSKIPYSSFKEQSYFYSPDLGEVPSLDIPIDLPDLPGIAGNVRYEEDSSFGIAPSVVMSPTSAADDIVVPNSKEDLEGLPETIPSTLELPEIQPEVPKQSNQEEIAKNEEVPLEVQEKPQEQSIETDFKTKTPQSFVEKQPEALDVRASLMEAIRQAGGAKKLKSVNIIENAPKNETSKGDLMADLHAKLAMRRKGISGTQKNNENVGFDSRGALSLMSAMIPPPEETTANEETDVEEDWD